MESIDFHADPAPVLALRTASYCTENEGTPIVTTTNDPCPIASTTYLCAWSPSAELAAASTWVSNWQRMLPVINATRGLLPRGVAKAVLNFVREPVALGRVEHEHCVGDPSLVRGTIFELLRTGLLRAPALHTQPLSLLTLLEPVQ